MVQLSQGRWQQQVGNKKMRILFNYWGINLAYLGAELQFNHKERGQLQVVVEWKKYFNKRNKRRFILSMGSFSINFIHLMLHGPICLLKYVML